MEQPSVFSPSIDRFAPISDASPLVSVIMTTWNDTRFMRATVDGVLAQTFTDFEFIIVDDGSDKAGEVQALAALDSRIRVHRLDRNVGAAEAGNIGVALARGPFIARTDYDDIADPVWLQTALAAFALDPELGMVGCWVALMSEHGDFLGVDATPVSDFAIRFTMLSHNPFYHSTMVYRREVFDRAGGMEAGQDETFDHRLWRAMLPHCRARAVPQALVRYRYRPGGITGSIDPRTTRQRTRYIREGMWRELGLEFPIDNRELANEVDNFLRQRSCRRADLWPQVSEVIKQAIAGTHVCEGQFLREQDRAERDAFVAALEARLLAGPVAPPGLVRRGLTALRRRGLRRLLTELGRRLQKHLRG